MRANRSSDVPVETQQGYTAEDSPISITVVTPADWEVLDLGQFSDLPTIRARVAASLAGYADAEGYASRISQLVGLAGENRVFFAAAAWPQEDGSEDVTMLTLAAPTVGPQEQVAIDVSRRAAKEIFADATPIQIETGPSQNAVDLPIGPAARAESNHILELGSPLPPVPVFCVEYAVTIPATESVIVLTFTTIAPSDTDSLREQFAGIASTLAFA